MENKNSYTIVGVFFVACLLFFGSFAWWLGVKREKGVQYESYFLHINELPGGIKDGTQVKFSGIDAGFVKSVGFDKNGDQIEIICMSNRKCRCEKIASHVSKRRELAGLAR